MEDINRENVIAEPDLLIFDELSSGLDPLGRHDLREVLLGLKQAGRTVFFSSHELTEVETLCDRVLIIHQGRIIKSGALADLEAETAGGFLEAYFIKLVRGAAV